MEEMLLDGLFNGDTQVQIQAASQLCKLSSRHRHKLVERGIISPLVSMLHSQDYEAVEAALLSLLSLAFGSERNKIRIVKSGVVPVLLELLQCQSEAQIELAVAAMLILSSCKANKLVIASSGAIQVLVEILSGYYVSDNGDDHNCSISMQAKLDAIATLHNLSTCHQLIPSIVSSGVTYMLLQLVHSSDKSSELPEKAVSLLENVVTLSENALQEVAATSGAIRALVEGIEEGSPLCKEHAVAILLLVCQNRRDKHRVLILREGVMPGLMPGLLQLSVDGTWRAQNMARELLLLLRDCSQYGSTSKQSKNELIEQIMEEIDAEGERVSGTTLRLVEEMIAKLST
ncbi:hypothetical protein Dsin_030926 [Dipteronia sinensis]|uniref:Uncharacterized protein n=1 Tax=Dipteronia sinensis TaxID=43782 RepID=A0AAD9ZKK5_9ROSI|nr:hypothetical protein Dsin_030926 [Dipteronia sinensis]